MVFFRRQAMMFVALSIPGFISCDSVHETAGSGGGALTSGSVNSAAAVSLFSQPDSLHPFVIQHCGQCHGNTQRPFFASSDVAFAYAEIAPRLNFSNSAGSRLVERLNEAHNCWSDCAGNSAEMKGAIDAFFAKIAASNVPADPQSADRISGSALAVPATLPTGTTYTTIAFSLPTLGANARLTLDIQEFAADAYRIRSPRLSGLAGSIRCEELRFLVNNVFRPFESAYAAIALDMVAPGGVLQANTMIILKDKGAGLDQLTPTFRVLRSL